MGNSFLLIVAGLLLFYLVISDKWKCVEGFAACVTNRTGGNQNIAPTSLPSLPQPSTPSLQNVNLPQVAQNLNWFQYGF